MDARSHDMAVIQLEDSRRRALDLSAVRVWPGVLVLFAAVCLSVRTIVILVRWNGYELGKYFFADDSFYYLRIAQNVVAGRGSTFDGSAPTNGYHPLWELCCVALHAIWPGSPASMVAVVYAIQTGLLLTAAALLYRGLRVRHSWAAALSVLLLMLNTITLLVLVDGMESGIAFTLLCSLAYFAGTRGDAFFDLRDLRYAITVSALLACLFLARLEAGVFGATFVAVAFARGLKTRGLQLTHTLGVGAALGCSVLLYVAFNLAITGLPVPVSGLVKSLWAVDPGASARLFDAQLGWFVSPLRLQEAFEHRQVELGLLVVLLAGLGVFVRDAWSRRQTGFVLLAGNCAFLILYNFMFTRQAFYWYGWPALFLGTLGCFGLFSRLLSDLSGWRGRLALSSIAVLALAYGAGTTYRSATRNYDRLYDWSSSPVLMDQAMRFLETEIPKDARIGGDSVGMLSYLSGRDIVNVEGLVGGRSYYESLKRGDSREFLRDRGINWLIATRPEIYAVPCARARTFDLGARARQETEAPVIGTVRIHKLDYSWCALSVAERAMSGANLVSPAGTATFPR
jgi:hypothetical protein